MDEFYPIPMNNMGLLGQWNTSGEDEGFFNALPEEKQQQILADCTTSEEFHERVRAARLCQ